MRTNDRCVNLTHRRMRQCKRTPGIIVVHNNGLMSLHCKQHAFEWYGKYAALPGSVAAYIRYSPDRAYGLSAAGPYDRVHIAIAFGQNDTDRMLSSVVKR